MNSIDRLRATADEIQSLAKSGGLPSLAKMADGLRAAVSQLQEVADLIEAFRNEPVAPPWTRGMQPANKGVGTGGVNDDDKADTPAQLANRPSLQSLFAS